MEENNLEEKLNIEKQILDLRREYKSVFNQLDVAKKEHYNIVALNKEKEKLVDENRKYLSEILKEIADAKIAWAQEKEVEWNKIKEKSTEADNIINKKKELSEKEQKLKEIDQKTQDKLDEIRRIELKVSEEKTALEQQKRALDGEKKTVEAKNQQIIEEKALIGAKLTKIAEEWQTK